MQNNNQFVKTFTFGPDNKKYIRGDREYSPETGFGFVSKRDTGDEQWHIPEINNGFSSYPANWDGRGKTAYFRIDVPRPGNYSIQMVLTCPDPKTKTTAFSERRRCVLWQARAGEDGLFRRSFTANVCDIIPRGKETVFRDGALDITVNGASLKSLSVREAPETRTIFILGDSTVTDQPADLPYDPTGCYCGWGQMLPSFLREGIAVSNHAHSGLTTQSFRDEGHWEIVSKTLKPGDYVLLQFGHNDQKLKNLAAYGGYSQNLKQYINEIRAKGAVPILVTPVSRSLWNSPGGKFNDLLKDWADACHAVAEAAGTPLIDLHEQSMNFIRKHGQEGSKPYFHPNDYTHFNDYGGYLMAFFVAGGIRETGLSGLSAFLRSPDETPVPSAPAVLSPARKCKETARPVQDPARVDIALLRPGISVSRAEFVSAACNTFLYLPNNVYSDIYPDIFGDEWYAGTIQGAFDNGLTVTPAGSAFRPGDPVSCAEALSFLIHIFQDRYNAPKGGASDPESDERQIHLRAERLSIDFSTPNGKLDGEQAVAMLKQAAAKASDL